MRFYSYLNEVDSGDKIKLKEKVKNLGGPKTSNDKMVSPGTYDVVEMWEEGILISKDNTRYFIPRNSKYEEIK